jgi:PAS domain S-box-containing protein
MVRQKMGMIPDYDEEAVKKAWEYYIAKGHAVPEQIPGLRPVILESWRRSQVSVKRGQSELPHLAGRELDQLMKDNKLLMDIAVPYLQDFYQYIQDSNHLVTLADRHGYQLKKIGRLEIRSAAGSGKEDSVPYDVSPDTFRDGTDFSEQAAGTNGIGTALAANEPVMIFGAEHYNPVYHHIACCSSPIYDPDGGLLGCINISGPLEEREPMIMGLLRTAVSGIEKQFKLTQRNNMLRTLLESLDHGVLMLDQSRRIQLYNRAAARLLRMEDEPLEGKSLFDIVKKESLPEEIRGLRTPITGEDCSLVNFKGKELDVSLTIIPASEHSHGFESTMLLLFSQTYIHQMASRLAGFSAAYQFDSIAGKSDAIGSVIAMGKLASEKSFPVLLFGEKGTGKRMLAQAIHNAGHQPQDPFVEFNCDLVPGNLLRSELFGSTSPYTGTRLPGRLELAEGGTLYLSEISALPMDIQKELVSFMKEKGACGKKFRLIASTCENLLLLIQKGAFREDLYYLLNTFAITIPPLRERTEDIPLIAEKMAFQTAGHPIRLTGETSRMLSEYEWTGNARMLEDVIRLSIHRADQEEITPDDLPSEISDRYFLRQVGTSAGTANKSGAGSRTASDAVSNDELREGGASAPASVADAKDYYRFTQALKSTRGNCAEAAEQLGIPVSTFYRRLSKLNIRARDFR